MNYVRFLVLVFAGVALGFRTQAADIRQGLVAYWQMEGTEGLTTPDATPFANHLNVVGLSSGNFVPGQFGNAVQLNGSSTYMTNLHSPDPSMTGLPIYRAGSYTITMWVKGPAQTARYLYSEANTNVAGSTAGQAPIVILQTGQTAANNSKFDVIIRNDANASLVNHVVSTAVVFDDNWHHIAWVDDRGSVRLYIDGNLDTANFNYTPAGNFTLNTSTVGALTRAAVQGFFNGFIDDVALWKRALSAAEVQEVRTSSLVTPIPEFPAAVIVQPVGSTNRVGDRVTFSATAEGNPPIGFQWLKDGTEIPGATASSLLLSNLVEGDSGDYTLRVTNRFGTNVSSVATLLVPPDPAPDLRQGIVSYWPLDDQLEDEFARATFFDVYGSNNFKVSANNVFVDQLPAVNGNGAIFNGIEEYCYREGGFATYGPPAFSVAFWVNAATAQIDRRIFAETSTNSNSPVFSFGTHSTGANGTLRVLVRNNSGVVLLDRNSTRTVFDGTWHHVAWSESNGVARLYIDGVLDETSFNYKRGPLSLNTTTLGALLQGGGATNFFNGMLDDVAVWSRAIFFAEVGQLRTSVVPPPLSNSPPAITLHPASQSVLTRARVTFSFAAIGTGPLSVQWRKGGAPLLHETNTLLVLSNVALADAGDYDVVVANAAGGATSQVATLSVTLRPVTSDLRVDFNNLGADDIPANTEPSFSSFALPAATGLGPFTRVFGGAEVTLTGVGGISMQSRKRLLPTNFMSFTEERLLQDFVFAPDTTAGQGMDIAIDFLEPNQTYALTIWSFDNANNSRFSDWSANGVTLTNGYTFTGSSNPVDNLSSQFTFPVIADAQGTVLVQGRRGASAAANNNVFLNALHVAVLGQLRVRKIELMAPASLRLTFDAINPAAPHRVEEKTDVDGSTWTEVAGAVFGAPNGNTIEVTIPVPATATRFYRIVENP